MGVFRQRRLCFFSLACWWLIVGGWFIDGARAEGGLNDWEGVGDDGLAAWCVRNGEHQKLQSLLKLGADVARIGEEGATPLQMAVAMRDDRMVKVLLEAGADANRKFPRPASGAFLSLCETESMRWFLRKERRLTPLMMAANHGDFKIIKALMQHGAKTEIRSGRYRLYPLNFASRRKKIKAMQMILGEDPEKERYYIILDLSDQHLLLYNQKRELVMGSTVSTGKAKFRTPTGTFVITDKHRKYKSKIYNAKMPYFQRLSCIGIGFHAGYCPGYPASHGCIRMPRALAKELFETTPVGTRVVIQE